MRGFWPVFRKEAVQMLRDKGSLRFALMTPAFQLILFGLIMPIHSFGPFHFDYSIRTLFLLVGYLLVLWAWLRGVQRESLTASSPAVAPP